MKLPRIKGRSLEVRSGCMNGFFALCVTLAIVGAGINIHGCIQTQGMELVPLRYDYHGLYTVGHYREARSGRCYNAYKQKENLVMLTPEPCVDSPR
jgi:hypothetical protein